MSGLMSCCIRILLPECLPTGLCRDMEQEVAIRESGVRLVVGLSGKTEITLAVFWGDIGVF